MKRSLDSGEAARNGWGGRSSLLWRLEAAVAAAAEQLLLSLLIICLLLQVMMMIWALLLFFCFLYSGLLLLNAVDSS